MTAKELSEHIGKWAEMTSNGLTVRVQIIDAKVSYGRPRYKITATDSMENTVWVDASRVTFN